MSLSQKLDVLWSKGESRSWVRTLGWAWHPLEVGMDNAAVG